MNNPEDHIAKGVLSGMLGPPKTSQITNIAQQARTAIQQHTCGAT